MSIFWAGGLEEKAKARKAAVLKLVWPWPPAAAFTYFPSLQLKLSQAFRPVCLIGRWTWKKNEKNYCFSENLANSYQMVCITDSTLSTLEKRENLLTWLFWTERYIRIKIKFFQQLTVFASGESSQLYWLMQVWSGLCDVQHLLAPWIFLDFRTTFEGKF